MRLGIYGSELARTVNVRRAVSVLTGTIAVLVALGLAERAGAPLTTFALNHEFSLPALLTGALLLLAVGLALLLASHGSRSAWMITAIALAVPAVDELVYAHQRIAARTELGWSAFLPLVVVCGAIWLAAARLTRERIPRWLVSTSALAWLGAQALEGALEDGGFAVGVVKQVVELVAAAMLMVGLLLELRARLGTTGTRPATQVLDEYVRGVSPRAIGAVFAALIVLVALAGSLVGADVFEAFVFDLNGEQTLPAAISGGFLFVAAGLALLLYATGPAGEGRWWMVLGAVFVALGIDEIGALHEKIQEATDIHPGQIVLLPLVIAAGLAWLVALRRMRDAVSRNLWVVGAGLWVLSQAVDATQPPERFVWSVVPEETLEMGGSALFAVALLLVLRERPRPALS